MTSDGVEQARVDGKGVAIKAGTVAEPSLRFISDFVESS